MNTKLFLFITLRIMLLANIFLVIIHLPEYFREFLGDTKITDYSFHSPSFTDTEWKWGIAHYVFLINSSLLYAFFTFKTLTDIENRITKSKLGNDDKL